MTRIEELRSSVAGEVFQPGDEGYAHATRTWDLAVVNRPPVALVAATVDDIAAGARWADENALGISILNTGHGALSSNDDALVIATERLNTVRIDPAKRRATVGPGARWADVTAAAGAQGLVGASGASAGVGVIGSTIGGGLGPLGRTLGFASDRVTALTVLDADNRPRRVDAADGEVFWALRGGGPITVVTELEFELTSVPRFYGGGVYFDGSDAETLLSAYAEWVDGLDERTTTSLALLHLPPVPQLPPELRGRFVVHLRFAHVDPGSRDAVADGRRLLERMLSAAPVIVDGTRPMAPADVPDIHRDPVAAQDVAYRGGLIDALDSAVIGEIVTAMSSNANAAPRLLEVRHLGGAYAHSPLAPNSTTGRDASFNVYVTATSTPASAADARALVDGVMARICPPGRAQLNFAGPAPEVGSILRLWSEDDARRLVDVARTLDPAARLRTGRPLR